MTHARDQRKKEIKEAGVPQSGSVQVPGPLLTMMLTGFEALPVGKIDGVSDLIVAMLLQSGNLTVKAMLPVNLAPAIGENLAACADATIRSASGLVVPGHGLVVPGTASPGRTG